MRTALRQSQLEVFRSSSFVIDRDDELALFHQMKNCENENDDLLLRDSAEEFVDAAFALWVLRGRGRALIIQSSALRLGKSGHGQELFPAGIELGFSRTIPYRGSSLTT
ncbi:hypothetical protein L195_g009785 [Trifolium pratense]|uniref:Uncharacterized protein n=1 Tax=Trifolium pratense TaxID=57577 RepID=A0A2K3PCX2_TRIPR|nr:hypothetical protein L195_g009785 [Trifolium pratense]